MPVADSSSHLHLRLPLAGCLPGMSCYLHAALVWRASERRQQAVSMVTVLRLLLHLPRDHRVLVLPIFDVLLLLQLLVFVVLDYACPPVFSERYSGDVVQHVATGNPHPKCEMDALCGDCLCSRGMAIPRPLL